MIAGILCSLTSTLIAVIVALFCARKLARQRERIKNLEKGFVAMHGMAIASQGLHKLMDMRMRLLELVNERVMKDWEKLQKRGCMREKPTDNESPKKDS